MPSAQSDALKTLMQSMNARLTANPTMDLTELRLMVDELQNLTAEPPGVRYEQVEAGGRPALWAVPDGATDGAAILYLHGGAFIANSMHSHRKLAGHVARTAGTRTLVLDFRLAPEHRFPAQLQDTVAAYQQLLAGRSGLWVALAGDSGGAGLAVATALQLRKDGAPPPVALAGMSPWMDLAAEFGDTFETNAAHDVFINRDVLRNFSAMYLGNDRSPNDPAANPFYADLSGLPPTYFSVGGHETLLGSVQDFARRAREAGSEVSVEVAPHMQHVHTIMAGAAPEADATIGHVGAFLRQHLHR